MSSSKKWRHTPIPPAEDWITAEMRKVSQSQLDLWDLITSAWVEDDVMTPVTGSWNVLELRDESKDDYKILILVIEADGKPLEIQIHLDEIEVDTELTKQNSTRFGDVPWIASMALEEEVFSRSRDRIAGNTFRLPRRG